MRKVANSSHNSKILQVLFLNLAILYYEAKVPLLIHSILSDRIEKIRMLKGWDFVKLIIFIASLRIFLSKIGFKSTHLLIYLTQCVTVKIAVTISTVWYIALICAKTPAILSIITFFLFSFWHFYCDKNFKTTKSTILTILKGHLEHPNVISVGFPCPGGSDSRSAYNVGDLGSIPGLGRCSREGTGNPLQYSCLENPMDGGVW